MELPAPAPVFIVIDRDRFRLRHYSIGNQQRVRVREFPIATGVVGRTTPRGEYRVVNKSVTPAWQAPAWAEGRDDEGNAIAGQVFEFEDDHNPFAGGFISIDDGDDANDNSGVGIHGTKFDPRVGTRASHGCVRMRTDDFRGIYEKVPKGTVVVIC